MLEFRVLEIDGLGEATTRDQYAAPRQRAAIWVLEQNCPEKGGPQYAALRPASRLRGIKLAAVVWRCIEICDVADADALPNELLLRCPARIG